jgi:hypothetical protein
MLPHDWITLGAQSSMVPFRSPAPPDEAWEATLRAVVVAARAGIGHLHAMRQAQGLPPLPFGAALHLGEILWGNIGAADRLDFTAIGPRGRPGQPAGGAVPAARSVGADLGRGHRQDRHTAGAAGRTRAARHRGALHRLHPAGCMSGSCLSPASRRLAMAVLDQDLGDLCRVQRATGCAVARAFAHEGARVFLSGESPFLALIDPAAIFVLARER